MKSSSKQKGWGTLNLLLMVVMISACAEKKNPARAPESRFGQNSSESDYFSIECHPGQRSGIVGGQAVRASDADSNRSILLIWEDANGQQSLCSATLIADQTLLTAAHCVNEAVKMQAVFYSDVSCESGYRRSQHSIAVDQMTAHPDYNTDIQSLNVLDENIDLALVHLAEKAPERFQIFRISKNPEDLTSNVFLYGFGATGTSKSDTMLLRKTVVERANIFFTNKALFFDQEDKTGVCSGDSGGAGLMEENGELVIASVNSEVFNGDITDSSTDLCNRNAKSIVVHHYLESWVIPTLAQWGQSLK